MPLPPLGPVHPNNRNLGLIQFRDANGKNCQLEQEREFLWLGVANGNRMKLLPEQADALGSRLQQFKQTRSLLDKEADSPPYETELKEFFQDTEGLPGEIIDELDFLRNSITALFAFIPESERTQALEHLQQSIQAKLEPA